MKRRFPISAGLLAAALATGAYAEEANNLGETITEGKFNLGFRYRLENVDQAGFVNDALASTLRGRASFTTAPLGGLSAFVEVDSLVQVGSDEYNDTRNGQTTYPVVADPDGTDINQGYLKYARGGLTAVLGRQRINIDNQRFIGGVGWRQNEQTYDSFSIGYKVEGSSVLYGYVDRIQRIFGPEAGTPDPSLDSDSHILHLNQDLGDYGKLSAYGYFLDVENGAAASTRTIGVRYNYTFESTDYQFPLTLEFARQGDAANNPADYSANYILAELGIARDGFKVAIGDEILGADSSAGVAFTTPLATLHKFQGWADKFLGTPASGIDDRYITVSGKVSAVTLAGTYHDFEADTGSASLGSELDLSASGKVGPVGVLVKFARYDADTFASDTTKIWVMLTYNLL